MTLHPQARTTLLTGTLFLALAVLIGAFGAHGLKNLVTEAKLVTFETGVRYHFYHAFALVLLGLFQQMMPNGSGRVSYFAFLSGILLFSFNCYLYAVLDMKIFAMIVPVGGLLFVLGWIGFLLAIKKAP